MAALAIGNGADLAWQLLGHVRRCLELQGCGAVVGVGLVGVKRLQVFDDGKEQASKFVDGLHGFAGSIAGGLAVRGLLHFVLERGQGCLGRGAQLFGALIALLDGLLNASVGWCLGVGFVGIGIVGV